MEAEDATVANTTGMSLLYPFEQTLRRTTGVTLCTAISKYQSILYGK
jgi:hypothetical protein